MSKASEDPFVEVKLSDIRKIRDAIANFRATDGNTWNAWRYVASLYNRLRKQADDHALCVKGQDACQT